MPPTLTAVEVHERLNKPETAIELHREALKAGVPLSRYLEVINPTTKDDELDAFQRQLKAAGIITHNNPRAGYWASKAKVFFDTPAGRALYPEFFAREWRSVVFASQQQKQALAAQARAILLSSDAVLGNQERPWVETGPYWNNQFAPAIPLSELVAVTSAIEGEDYRSLYMTYDEDALRLFRIGESAEIPMATLDVSRRANHLHKYGRGLRFTYEALRRMRVDKVAWWIRWQALQSEIDKVSAALTVLVSGDGNAGTAATEVDLTDMDAAATPPNVTLKAWINFRMQFTQPYVMTTALMQADEALQIVMLNAGTANMPLAGLNLAGIGNTLTPINPVSDGIRYGWTAEAPDAKIIGFDNRFALEHVTEIGSEITETDRFITNQTEVMTMTETSGFGILDPAATKVLDLAE